MKYEAAIADLEENIAATKEQKDALMSKKDALVEQATNANLATELAEKIANEKESMLNLLAIFTEKVIGLEKDAKEGQLALNDAIEQMEQLQYEAESEVDDNLKAEKMKAYEGMVEEVDTMTVNIESAESQGKELRRTMRSVRDDAKVRDA